MMVHPVGESEDPAAPLPQWLREPCRRFVMRFLYLLGGPLRDLDPTMAYELIKAHNEHCKPQTGESYYCLCLVIWDTFWAGERPGMFTRTIFCMSYMIKLIRVGKAFKCQEKSRTEVLIINAVIPQHIHYAHFAGSWFAFTIKVYFNIVLL